MPGFRISDKELITRGSLPSFLLPFFFCFFFLFSVSRFLSIFQFLSCLLLHFQDNRAVQVKWFAAGLFLFLEERR